MSNMPWSNIYAAIFVFFIFFVAKENTLLTLTNTGPFKVVSLSHFNTLKWQW